MENYDAIKKIIGDYTDLMEGLIGFEQNKLDAILNKDTELLDIYLKEEQVYLLQFRGLDQKREAAQKQMGFDSLTYRQIIDKAEEPDKGELQEAYEKLSFKITEFKGIADTVKSHIDLKLHTIDVLLENFGEPLAAVEQQGIYSQIGAQTSTSPNQSGRFHSTKV